MHYTPHDYQAHAIAFIVDHPIAAILLDMGLGKTVITLTAIDELMLDRFEISRTLVIAPLRVARDTWPAEAAKWDHLRHLTVSVMVGSPAERRAALTRPAHVYVINRENLVWLVDELDGAWPFDMIVIDELSSFKSHQAKRFKALTKVRPLAKRAVGLTGTPASNGLMDLFAQFRVLDMGERLGRFITRYREAFFVPDKRSAYQVFSYKPRPGAEDEIYERIADITMSMKSADHLDLPGLVEVNHTVELEGRERRLYEQLKNEMVVELEGREIDAVSAGALSGKLLQLASGAIYDEAGDAVEVHGRKLDALEDLVEAANGQSVLVAYWFKHDRARIEARIPGAVDLKSSADFAAWNRGEIPVALIHPASAGHGLNLQAGGHHLVWFSLTWSLELYQQTNARLHRQGQTETVTVHHLVAAGTLDESVMSALAGKDVTQSALIDAVKATLQLGKARRAA